MSLERVGGTKINLGQIGDFLDDIEHILEAIEKDKMMGSGHDPIEVIKKEKYSQVARKCLDQIHEIMRRRDEKIETKNSGFSEDMFLGHLATDIIFRGGDEGEVVDFVGRVADKVYAVTENEYRDAVKFLKDMAKISGVSEKGEPIIIKKDKMVLFPIVDTGKAGRLIRVINQHGMKAEFGAVRVDGGPKALGVKIFLR